MTDLSDLPSPPIPASVDLKDFPFFPLDAVRLRDSDLAIKAKAEEFRAAILLWCAAWHQVPASSLPDDDEVLASYAGFGRFPKEWKKIRAGALRGFRLFSDGRLYHTVLSEKAAEAWEGKLKRRHLRECERIKKAAQRAGTQPSYPSFDEWSEHVTATGSDRWSGHDNEVPEMSHGTYEGQGQGHGGDVHNGVPGESHPLKGQGEGKGQGQGDDKEEAGDSLRSSSSTAAPPTTAGDDAGSGSTNTGGTDEAAAKAKAERLRTHTRNAMLAYNATLTRPRGVLAKVTELGLETREQNVRRCLRLARRICELEYDTSTITLEFWKTYFAAIAEDTFKSGRQDPGPKNPNWKPTFEYLTRAKTMLEVYEAVLDGQGDEFLVDDGDQQA
jgi:hypothetical protein